MNAHQTPPNSAEVNESVTRVRTRLFTGLRRPEKKHPFLRVAGTLVAAAGLFATGIAVGAATYAPNGVPATTSVSVSPEPAAAPATPAPSEFAFRIDCYVSWDPDKPIEPDARIPSIKLGYNSDRDIAGFGLGDARANPVEACQSNRMLSAQSRAISDLGRDVISVQHQARCAVVSMQQLRTSYLWLQAEGSYRPFWEQALADAEPRQLTDSGPGGIGAQQTTPSVVSSTIKPGGFPDSECLQLDVPAPEVRQETVAACTVSDDKAAVYVMEHDAVTTCQKHGYSVWQNPK